MSGVSPVGVALSLGSLSHYCGSVEAENRDREVALRENSTRLCDVSGAAKCTEGRRQRRWCVVSCGKSSGADPSARILSVAPPVFKLWTLRDRGGGPVASSLRARRHVGMPQLRHAALMHRKSVSRAAEVWRVCGERILVIGRRPPVGGNNALLRESEFPYLFSFLWFVSHWAASSACQLELLPTQVH